MNIMPSLKYSSNESSQVLSISVSPVQFMARKFILRPNSNYGRKLFNSPLLASNGAVLIEGNSRTKPAYEVGGVKILSKRYSRINSSQPDAAMKKSSDAYDKKNTQIISAVMNRAKTPTSLVRKFQGSKKNHTQTIESNQPLIVTNTQKSSIIGLQKKSLKVDSKSKSRFTGIVKSSQTNPTTEKKATKVYLSQKQSPDVRASNEGKYIYPSAPPGTPSNDMKKQYLYVPSLSDNLAKQQVKSRLKVMKQVEVDKERAKQLEKQKNDLKDAKEKEQELKKQQRRLIYILNAAMTLVENEQFEKFKQTNGLRLKEYPSPLVKK